MMFHSRFGIDRIKSLGLLQVANGIQRSVSLSLYIRQIGFDVLVLGSKVAESHAQIGSSHFLQDEVRNSRLSAVARTSSWIRSSSFCTLLATTLTTSSRSSLGPILTFGMEASER